MSGFEGFPPPQGSGGGGGYGMGDDPTFGDVTADSLDLGGGTAGAPSLTFGDSDTGIWAVGGNNLSFSAQGGERARISGSLLSTTNQIAFGASLAVTDLRLRRSAASTLTVDADGAGAAASLVVTGSLTAGTFSVVNSGGTTDLNSTEASGTEISHNGTRTALFNTTAITLSEPVTFNAATNFTQTAAADTTTPTLIALPTGGTAAQAGWVAIQVNGSTAWLPYWQ